MKKLLIFLIVSIVACQQKPRSVTEKPAIDPRKLISCNGVGEITMDLSYADLEKKVGANSITEHENTVAGKFFTVWEGADKQLNIYWNEKHQPYKTIKYIEVGSGPFYLTADSLYVGISMRDMVRINGNMPLTFNNFSEKRDNGLITSFNNGNIGKANPCITGTLEITSERNVHVNEREEFNSKKELESFDPLFERIDVALQSIRVYPKK